MADNPFDTSDPSLLDVASRAEGPSGSLPFTAEMLLTRPSGDLFGWSQNAGMGWNPAALGGREFLILSTHGGVRAPDGTPIALGYHTGHWEVGLLVEEAAKTLKAAGAVPFAAACTDPCDGRSQDSGRLSWPTCTASHEALANTSYSRGTKSPWRRKWSMFSRKVSGIGMFAQ